MAIRSTLSCFTDFIGIGSECLTENTPSSGLYVKDLPGIDIITAGDVNTDYTNGITHLQNTVERVIEEEIDNLSVIFSSAITTVPVLEAGTVGEWRDEDDGNDFVDTYSGVGGVQICIKGNNPFKTINVQTVEALANETGERTIRIYDGDDSTAEVVTITEAGVPASVDFNYKAIFREIKVGWDTSLTDLNDSRISYKGCNTCGSNYWNNSLYKYAKVGGFLGLTNGEEWGDLTFGLRVQFTIECDWERAACQLLRNNPQFARLVWYAIGIRFAEQVKMTNRFNSLTNLRGADFEDQLDETIRGSWAYRYEMLKGKLSEGLQNSIAMYAKECALCKSDQVVTFRP